MLKPMPDWDDAGKMARIGRAQAAKDARLDASHQLRDSVTMLQREGVDYRPAIAAAREALDRIEKLVEIGEWL